jgi:hypothetical protein
MSTSQNLPLTNEISYLRYNKNIMSSTSDFQTWWKNLANEFKGNSKVIFDVNNEPWVRVHATFRTELY